MNQSDETELVFSAEKMLERVKKNGMESLLDRKTLAFIHSLDGQPVNVNSFNRQVMDEPVYACRTQEGDFVDVNENDCISKP